MLIYLESCESGSMFEGFLPTDLDILAVTASNSTESSYACFYNETMNTFLADVFSYRKLRILINPITKYEFLNPNSMEEPIAPTHFSECFFLMKNRFGHYELSENQIYIDQPSPHKQHKECPNY